MTKIATVHTRQKLFELAQLGVRPESAVYQRCQTVTGRDRS